MIETAVILAAGLGTRLKAVAGSIPKAFLEIEGNTLISMSLDKLSEVGIKKILIGTGYQHTCFEKLSLSYPQVTCYLNPEYSNSGSMCTLYKAGQFVDSGFLLLESDLLYDISGLHILLESRYDDVILASGQTNAGDEVFIEHDNNMCLVNMSKNVAHLKQTNTELVGINKISADAFNLMCKYFEELGQLELDYENALVEAARHKKIYVHKIEDYAWCEVDTQEHWKRAVNEVYPKITKSEKQYKT